LLCHVGNYSYLCTRKFNANMTHNALTYEEMRHLMHLMDVGDASMVYVTYEHPDRPDEQRLVDCSFVGCGEVHMPAYNIEDVLRHLPRTIEVNADISNSEKLQGESRLIIGCPRKNPTELYIMYTNDPSLDSAVVAYRVLDNDLLHAAYRVLLWLIDKKLIKK